MSKDDFGNFVLNEEIYTPSNYKDYLSNKEYHHSEKDCDIEMRAVKELQGGKMIKVLCKYCKTHDKLCSRTGWEWGRFLGTDSRKIYQEDFGNNTCSACGNLFLKTNNKSNYCNECNTNGKREQYVKERRIEREQLKRTKIPKQKNIKEYYRLKRISDINEELKLIQGFIGEYQKADYKDRIDCEEYNELITKQDKLVSDLYKYKNYNKNPAWSIEDF